jgi:protein-S-isoprenylcysteine O-methyltransferase Ste14
VVTDAALLGAVLCSVLALSSAVTTTSFDLARTLRLLRASWWAGFVVFATSAFVCGNSDTSALTISLVTAFSSAAVNATRPRLLALVPLVPLAVAAANVDALLLVSCATAVASSAWLLRAMARDAHPRIRVTLHGISAVGTLAVFLPVLCTHFVAVTDPIPAKSPIVLFALAVGVAGLAMVFLSARTLLEHSGTPDPADPPHALIDTGIYAHIRNPMQLGEIAIVVAACAVAGGVALAYAAAFALVVIFPFRMLEEAMLKRRFGRDYEAYRRRVPAYVPRRPSLEKNDEDVATSSRIHHSL